MAYEGPEAKGASEEKRRRNLSTSYGDRGGSWCSRPPEECLEEREGGIDRISSNGGEKMEVERKGVRKMTGGDSFTCTNFGVSS